MCDSLPSPSRLFDVKLEQRQVSAEGCAILLACSCTSSQNTSVTTSSAHNRKPATTSPTLIAPVVQGAALLNARGSSWKCLEACNVVCLARAYTLWRHNNSREKAVGRRVVTAHQARFEAIASMRSMPGP